MKKPRLKNTLLKATHNVRSEKYVKMAKKALSAIRNKALSKLKK